MGKAIKPSEERPYRSAWASDWLLLDDDRVSCGNCSKKNGAMCQETKRTHVPVNIKHRCVFWRVK